MDGLKFDEYRFHFRPYGLPDLFTNVDEVLARKNQILDSILKEELNFSYKTKQLKHQFIPLGDNYFHLRIANSKKAEIEQDFERITIENEPSAHVFIWNDKEQQKILIESDKTSFGESKAVAKILENAINEKLIGQRIKLVINPELEETEFWELVKTYQGQITKLEFDLLYPNLPASHSTISDELEEAFKSIAAIEGAVQFKAEKDSTLQNINEQNPHVNSLNKAASIQGMPVKIKIKTERKWKKTGKQKKSTIIIETLTNDNTELLKLMKKYLA